MKSILTSLQAVIKRHGAYFIRLPLGAVGGQTVTLGRLKIQLDSSTSISRHGYDKSSTSAPKEAHTPHHHSKVLTADE